MKWRRGAALAALVSIVALAGCPRAPGTGGSAATGPPPEIRETLPDLTFTTLEGRSVRLADLRGKVVVLDVWHMLCLGCVEELTHYQAAPELVANRQVALLAVTEDTNETALRKFVEEKGWTFPVASITPAVRQALLGPGQAVLPQVRVLGPEGLLHYRLGPEQANVETLKQLVRKLLPASPDRAAEGKPTG